MLQVSVDSAFTGNPMASVEVPIGADLPTLRAEIERASGVPPSKQLLLAGGADEFREEDLQAALTMNASSPGGTPLCLQLLVVEGLGTLAARVSVHGAGVEDANGTYQRVATNKFTKEGFEYQYSLQYFPATAGSWPAGWYLQESRNVLYYVPISVLEECMDDSVGDISLPKQGWEVYDRGVCRTGRNAALPVPTVSAELD